MSPYKDILTSSYWVIMTATTVGYGDYTPTSSGGRVVAVLCAVCGIIAIALPMTIITRSFNDGASPPWQAAAQRQAGRA